MTNQEVELIAARYADPCVELQRFFSASREDVLVLAAALRRTNAIIESVRVLAFAAPKHHSDASCTDRCVTELCYQIHAVLAESESVVHAT